MTEPLPGSPMGDAAGRDDGAALIEFVGIGICLLLPLVYVVLAVMRVQAAAFGVTEAARQAGRAYVQAESGDALRHAQVAARLALEDQGVATEHSTMTLSCDAACHASGSAATVHVTARVSLPFLPDALAASSIASVVVTAEHRVVIESLRGDQ